MQSNSIFHNWLTARKITEKVIEDFNLGEDTRLIIPVHDENGIFIFNKYRRHPLSDDGPKYSYDSGGKVSLYAWHKAKDCNHILITEGEADTLVAWSAGIAAVTSTGGALSFQKEWGELFIGKNVTVCFDNDSAGGDGMVKVLSIIPHAKILFLPDRPGIKDISDYVTNGGDLNNLLPTARRFDSIESVKSDRADRIAVWQSTYFHDAFIKEHEKPVKIPFKRDSKMTDKLLRAKEYPITELLEFKRGSARCIFHAEKESSLHYYPDTNKCWCFGACGRGYDSIDIYKKLNNCSFKEAVYALQ